MAKAPDPGAEDRGVGPLFEKLEKTVNELEREEVELERAMELFREGMRLTRLLDARLQTAEQEVFRLVEEAGGELGLELFDPPSRGPGGGTEGK